MPIKKIDIFDFDGTLVFTPFPAEGKRQYRAATGRSWPHKKWWDEPASLKEPLTWEPNNPVIADFQDSLDDPDILTIMMTGRVPELESRVLGILKEYGVKPEESYFKGFSPTVEWKKEMLGQFVLDHPDAESIEMWEDRPPHADIFEELDLGIPLSVNRIPQKLNEKIVKRYARNTHYHPEDFTAYFMLGVPGAGKSTYVKENLADTAICNPDYSEDYVEGAIKKFERQLELCEANVAFDFIGSNVPLLKRLTESCFLYGYNPRVIYVRTSPIVASYRATMREFDSDAPIGDRGRHVSYTEIEHCFRRINESMPEIIDTVGPKNVHVYNGKNLRMLGESADIKFMLREGRKKGRSAGICVLRKFGDDWKILVLRLYKGYDLPKGRIDPGEDPLEAARRECREETSIYKLNFKWGDECSTNERMTMFAATTAQDPKIVANPKTGEKEHHQAIWMSLDKAEEKVYTHLKDALAWVKDLVKEN